MVEKARIHPPTQGLDPPSARYDQRTGSRNMDLASVGRQPQPRSSAMIAYPCSLHSHRRVGGSIPALAMSADMENWPTLRAVPTSFYPEGSAVSLAVNVPTTKPLRCSVGLPRESHP
jgi:hypothetical protein